jgi:hypothetical protein
MRILFTLLFISVFAYWLKAQDKPKEPEGELPGIVLIDLAYAMQLPAGDMKKDFNFNFNFGSRVSYVLPKNWLFGLNGEWLFSDKIKTDVLAPLRVDNGQIIEITGNMGLTSLGQRGFYLGAHVGHLLSISKAPRRHNLEFRFGAGYLQHWVRIRILSRQEDLPQLSGAYLRGYDRRTSGLALQQYFGYRYMSKSKLINLFIGVDITEGFTKNRRYWNYDTREADTKQHIDLLMGFKAGFTIPIYTYTLKTRTDEIEFY